jgi:hypothetical protein
MDCMVENGDLDSAIVHISKMTIENSIIVIYY